MKRVHKIMRIAMCKLYSAKFSIECKYNEKKNTVVFADQSAVVLNDALFEYMRNELIVL